MDYAALAYPLVKIILALCFMMAKDIFCLILMARVSRHVRSQGNVMSRLVRSQGSDKGGAGSRQASALLKSNRTSCAES